jgi:hypothetical protein
MIPASTKSEIARLRGLDWQCIEVDQKREFPEHIRKRYKCIPREYIEFVESLMECTNTTNTQWFLSLDDFAGTSGYAFAWDEWERMSLESAEEDPELIRSIREFWDAHLPIHFDVSDGYAYHAIRLSDGVVVAGREPEFEETEEVASSFLDFLAAVN